ncbi:MAG TPA: FAD-dependent oxidoreductase [Burkholderiales bacterium]|nr:FAD-dependent oxidoreductase [Burkholderiales bacterium]
MSETVTEADVIVVGGGGAGLAAAAEAARLGRSVILLEKNPEPGGSTSWSVGSVTATNTPHQQRVGIQDSPQEHFEDLAAHAGALAPRDNLALRRVLVDNTTDMLEWLMSLGVVFVGPMPDPPHRYPRMHNVVPNSKSFAYHLTRRCRELDVDLRVNTACERLIEEGGRVVGVEARTASGGRQMLRTRGGVVLAAGDYSGASDLKRELASSEVADVEAVNASSTGDGHRMALALGASVANGDIVRGPIMRFIPPTRSNFIQKIPPAKPIAQVIAWAMDVMPQWLLRPFLMSFLTTALGPSPDLFKQGAILINGRGERFTDELAKPAFDVAKQPERIAYIVFDDELAQKFSAWPYFVSTAPGVAYAYLKDYRRNRSDIYHEASSVESLAASMKVPAEVLAQALTRYNATDHGARPQISRGPYYALGPIKSYVVFTDGGLKVSEQLEVLGANGAPIPGLYAAGSTGQGGLLLEGHGHHLGWAFISGRIAGRNAAFHVPPRSAA